MNWSRNVYKPSSHKKPGWSLLKTLLQTSLFWLIFLYLLPQAVLWGQNILEVPSFHPLPLWGWICFASFGLLGLSSGIIMSLMGKGTPLPMDCAPELVVRGPYKWVRNPMAVAGIGQGIAVGVILGSWMVIIYSLAGAFIWHYLVRPSEEADLAARFGQSYQDYRQRTPLWIPRLIN
ncbi:MAG: isoprenylcysteine carboxylmethyltransferase family protein [Bacteroidia bacterium]|nr:isoprenylcysteine carboxylmethyltransferase family protein [Bacteroidia bacterium]